MGFDVKILKEGFIKGWEMFKTSFPQKALYFWAFRDWASREVQSQKFSRVASESPNLLDELANGVSQLASHELSHE